MLSRKLGDGSLNSRKGLSRSSPDGNHHYTLFRTYKRRFANETESESDFLYFECNKTLLSYSPNDQLISCAGALASHIRRRPLPVYWPRATAFFVRSFVLFGCCERQSASLIFIRFIYFSAINFLRLQLWLARTVPRVFPRLRHATRNVCSI